ncbi:metal-dependent transcriptional regulator [Romboutsia lituseburensis]|uniref:metal-dependent transcriptional regulator n=1 Tax=Romboutsia lituseburensis TaxID=1537 RepID=UPI0022EB371C|nr:iron dependent repressor, metal binding and dimerization domain protein [Romboutsia lituseburensis]
MNQYYTFSEYIKEHELTPSEEDYVEMIYRLYLEDHDIKVAKLAKSLNVKTPSASNMVKRLQNKELLIHESYGKLKLTSRGEFIGKTLLLRHNAIEEFLRIIGVNSNLHEETEKIEHTISHETLNNIIKLVSFFNENNDILNKYNNYKML